MKATALLSCATIALSFTHPATAQPDAHELVLRADQNRRGKTSVGTMTMTVERPAWSRSVTMKSWSLGTQYSLILITAPAKEKGQVFLKRENEMWSFVPSIDRIIKLPPSMMGQSWMGSDFTNDDLLKESSLAKDYTQKIVGSEKDRDYDCWKVELLPKEDAAVVWGRVLLWITKKGEHIVRVERYDEDEELMSTEKADQIKHMDDRDLPTHMEMIPADKEGNRTTLTIDDISFNKSLSKDFFSQQNMKRIR